MKTMGVNITTIAYLRVLIIEIGSTIILMVVEAQGDNVHPDGILGSAEQLLRHWCGWVGNKIPTENQPRRRNVYLASTCEFVT